MTEPLPAPALSPLRIEIDAILSQYECYVTGTACERNERLSLQEATERLAALVARERMKAVGKAFDGLDALDFERGDSTIPPVVHDWMQQILAEMPPPPPFVDSPPRIPKGI